MGEKVIVVLDRDAAHYAAGHTLPDVSRIPEWQRATMDAAQAALDRDREALIEQVARAIYGDETGLPWVYFGDEPGWNREVYRKHARAALAAIERADQEEGDDA